ncbi:DUF2254 family protein [Pseudotamlana carrageenivorans]|uniref:DUF2254 family protein n=1 Tax=Pseudotamlana carrageenivorans TaxID=2069432 RepID=UPI00241156D9|nr:DUF2254 family protein [Tamlana carrageenivorans]
MFDGDPRFGLITLTEIASRALSTWINDPGTAIQIIGCHEKLFYLWNNPENTENDLLYDRLEIAQIEISNFFDDAFKPISRDGTGFMEVILRLQKTFCALEKINHDAIKTASKQHSKYAFTRAQIAMDMEEDLEILEKASLFRK